MSRGHGRQGLKFFTTPLGIVFTTVLIDLIGFGIVIPLMPLYAETFGASPTEIGLLTASFAFMQLLFAPVWGRLSDKVGRRPVILASLVGTAVASLIFGLAGALWLLFLARILDGISGASYGAAQAYVADVTSPQERAHGMGLIGAAFGLGFVVGPALGALFAAVDPRMPFFVAAGLAAANFALAWRRLPESRRPDAAPSTYSRVALLRSSLASRSLAPLVWLSFVGTFGFVAMEATFALLGERRFDFGLVEIGLVFTFIGVVAVVVQGGLVRRLVPRIGEWPTLRAGLVMTAAALALLAVVESLWALFPVLALLALGSGLVFPTVTSLVSKRAPEGDQGGVLGLMASTGGLARVTSPILATVLFEHVGVAAPYVLGAVLFALCAVYAFAGAGSMPEPLAAGAAGGSSRDV
jgi:MFS transporter, DHA1 family, tetracycline resistance protein